MDRVMSINAWARIAFAAELVCLAVFLVRLALLIRRAKAKARADIEAARARASLPR